MSENSNYWVVDYSICLEHQQEPVRDNGVPCPITYETIDYCNKKNSEDEKIIRFFAELATDACGGPGQEYYEELGLNYDKVMTWLEKQKEQDKCPEYCVMSNCMGCPIYEKKKEDKPSIFPPGLGEVRWNPISSVQQKPAEGTDFTIYHPLKNGKGEYECIPYSFYGSLTSFSEDKDLIDFLRTCFYTEEECEEWIERQKKQTEELSTRLNGVMQEYVKAGKDEEDQEHRLKCYQLFWDTLGDSEFFKQKPTECSYPYGRNETADRLVSLAECLEMDGDCLFNGYSGTECGKFLRDLARKYKAVELSDGDDVVEEAEEYTSKVACGEYGVEVTEAYIAGVLSERNRGTEWSDDDKTRLKVIKEELERFIMFNQYGTPLSVDDIGWLETLPERFNLQPKGEWNEEDEKIIEGMIVDYKGEIEHLSDSIIDEQAKSVYQGRIDFLNRLKTYCPESYDNDVQNKIEDAIYLIEHYASHGHDKNFRGKVISELKSLRPIKQEWSKEDETRLKVIKEELERFIMFNQYRTHLSVDDIAWIETLPERFNLQSKQEWSEDWREEDIQTRFAFYTYKDDPSVLYLSNVFVEETSRNHGFGTRILRAAEKVAEAIGATTISLKVKQNSPVNAWYRKNGYGYVAFEDGYDWLEKNLEYMKPNKQEWSEEDKETFEKLRRLLVICRGEKKFIQEADYNKMDNLLKSLRPPQYCENCKLKRSVENWKPSEEQIGTLKRWLQDHELDGDSRYVYPIFYSLLTDLQNL